MNFCHLEKFVVGRPKGIIVLVEIVLVKSIVYSTIRDEYMFIHIKCVIGKGRLVNTSLEYKMYKD